MTEETLHTKDTEETVPLQEEAVNNSEKEPTSLPEKSEATPATPTTTPEDKNPRRRQAGARRPRRVTKERSRPEFEQKLISVRRVTRVVAGGRRFSFSVAMVAGDQNGRVGVGTGKASDTALAIEKALRLCKKNMITIARTENNSIRHEIGAKYASSVVALRPAPRKGLVAGGAIRTVLEFAGITDVTAKILSRSKNSLNNAMATIEALRTLKQK